MIANLDTAAKITLVTGLGLVAAAQAGQYLLHNKIVAHKDEQIKFWQDCAQTAANKLPNAQFKETMHEWLDKFDALQESKQKK